MFSLVFRHLVEHYKSKLVSAELDTLGRLVRYARGIFSYVALYVIQGKVMESAIETDG